MNRSVRIAILLFILLLVGMDSLLTRWRSTDWDQSLVVVVYPINGDDSRESAAYIDFLNEDHFANIAVFFNDQAGLHAVELIDPFVIKLAPELKMNPPLPPTDSSIFKAVWWSLKMRYWSLRHDSYKDIPADIKVFVRYHQFRENKRIDHSIGLEKGRICIVNAYAHPLLMLRNQVIITHEILHTLGATDKYDYTTEMPLYPEGFADTGQRPLFPQQTAEIMAGYIPLSENKSIMAASLAESMVGAKTAREIGWLK